MPEGLAGRCSCGALTATFSARPVQTRQCWCRQCQKAAAGGPTHNAIFNTDDVALSGTVGSWSYLAPSGNTLTQAFCRDCGTPAYAQSSARPQFMTFRFGFLDESHGLAPEMLAELAHRERGKPDLLDEGERCVDDAPARERFGTGRHAARPGTTRGGRRAAHGCDLTL